MSVQETATPSPVETPVIPVADLSVRGLMRLALGNVRQFGMLAALVLGLILFQFTTGGVMLKSLNVTNIFLQNGYIMVMVLGMLLVIVIGHIDLSVGSVAAFTGAVAAVMMTSLHLDPVIAVILTLALGAGIGVWQGFWIAYLGVPSFIVTLAGMLLFRGLTLWMLGGQPIGPFDESFRAIASGFLPEVIGSVPDPFGLREISLGPIPVPLGGGALHLSTLVLGALGCVAVALLGLRSRREQIRYGFQVSPTSLFVLRNVLITVGIMFLAYRISGYNGLPMVALIAFVLVGIYMFITLRTVIGRRIYAVGGNAKAAMLSGVNSKRMVFLTFVNMGILAALGGLIIAARFNSATPKAGYGFELDVIAATFVGGASMYGGIGTVAGAVIGALFFGVLNIGMGIMSIPIDYQFAIKALVLLGAVFIDVRAKSADS
jgi:putative multiple sugar transport system permease protein